MTPPPSPRAGANSGTLGMRYDYRLCRPLLVRVPTRVLWECGMAIDPTGPSLPVTLSSPPCELTSPKPLGPGLFRPCHNPPRFHAMSPPGLGNPRLRGWNRDASHYRRTYVWRLHRDPLLSSVRGRSPGDNIPAAPDRKGRLDKVGK